MLDCINKLSTTLINWKQPGQNKESVKNIKWGGVVISHLN